MRFSLDLGVVQRQPYRPREAKHEIGDLAQIPLQAGAVDRGFAEAGAERVVMGAEAVELRPQFAKMGEVADPDRPAPDLVLISRADAAPGGADLALAAGILAQGVEIAVEGKDERAIVCDLEIVGGDGDALRRQLFDLGLERPGVQHHAVADDRQGAAHDA